MKEKDIRISIRIPDTADEAPIVSVIKEQVRKIGIPDSKLMYKVVPSFNRDGDRHGS